MESVKGQKIRNIAGYGLILLLAAEVVFLTMQNRDLKTQLESIAAASHPIDPLKPGELVEPFSATTMDGGRNTVSFSDPAKKHLLFVLSTTCPHCAKTLPYWKEIANKKTDNVDILGVSIHSLDATKEYVVGSNVNFYTVSVDSSFNRKYKVSGVPETILIDGMGKVEKAWIGELSSAQTAEIENLLSASKASLN